MGLYDVIHCEYPLPHDDAPSWFQTKNLGLEMQPYWLDKDGYLWDEHNNYVCLNNHTIYMCNSLPFTDKILFLEFQLSFVNGQVEEVLLLESSTHLKLSKKD